MPLSLKPNVAAPADGASNAHASAAVARTARRRDIEAPDGGGGERSRRRGSRSVSTIARRGFNLLIGSTPLRISAQRGGRFAGAPARGDPPARGGMGREPQQRQRPPGEALVLGVA